MDLESIKQQLPPEPPLVNLDDLDSLSMGAATILSNGQQWTAYLIGEVEKQKAEIETLKNQLAELNLAMTEYANETGSGRLFFDNLQLCLNVVRQRKR